MRKNLIAAVGALGRHRGKALLSVLALSGALFIAAAPNATGAVSPNSLAPKISRAYCGHGIWSIRTSPVRGFNPLTATAAELNANNYPMRPPVADAHEYAQWKKFAVSHSATGSTCASLHQSNMSARRLRHRYGAIPRAASKSTNWAGYVIHNNTYSDAEAEWDLPNVFGIIGKNLYSDSWVGIGLGNSSTYPLMQAGSESDALDSNSPGDDYYSLWFGFWPESIFDTVDVNVSVGDLVGAHVTVDGSAAGCGASTCVFFHVWDASTGFTAEYVEGGDWSNDGHAEWIYERPCIISGSNCEIQYLARAAPVFTEAQAAVSGAGWLPMGDYSWVELTMWNCPGTQELAYPGTITANDLGFNTYFENNGDANQCSVPS
jgi:Peptidase A4 family